MNEYIFLTLAIGGGISALLIVILKNIFRATIALASCILFIAAMFGMLGAEFIAITQVLIYGGGVITLILFGIMLTHHKNGEAPRVSMQLILPALCISLGLFFFLIYVHPIFQSVTASLFSIRDVGFSLFASYVAPFEWSGLLLLISLIGAAYMASFKRPQS